jgi:hypothetical protein
LLLPGLELALVRPGLICCATTTFIVMAAINIVNMTRIFFTAAKVVIFLHQHDEKRQLEQL